MPVLTDYRVLTFDCYGTLIDWECGIWDALQPLMMRNSVTCLTRDAVLRAFAQCESRQERATPGLRYPELLARVHARVAARLGLQTDDQLDAAFGASLPHWPAFPDTADALRILKQHYRLVILSNVHRDGIADSNRKLGVEFDAIYTAEDVGAYKPADANFEYLLAHLKSGPGAGTIGRAAHRAESAPRPCTGKEVRACQRLDRPAAAIGGRELGRDRACGNDAEDRLRLFLVG